MRRLLAYLVSSLLILLAFWPQSALFAAYRNNFYWQQQQMRQQQMMQQQRQQQEMMRRQAEQRRQQEAMRRQQEAMRQRQRDMQRQMQERQRQAQIQRQQAAERQRQLQQQRQRKTQDKQRTEGQQKQIAKQYKLAEDRRSLQEQRKFKLRNERLRKLSDARNRQRQKDKKKDANLTNLTMRALLRKNTLSVPERSRTVGKTSASTSTLKSLVDKRRQQSTRTLLSERMQEKQRLTAQRLQKLREKSSLAFKAARTNKKAVSKEAATKPRKPTDTAGNNANSRAIDKLAKQAFAVTNKNTAKRISDDGKIHQIGKFSTKNAFAIKVDGQIQVFVHRDFKGYRNLAKRIDPNLPRNVQIDHAASKAVEKGHGQEYIRLARIPARVNMQHGSVKEKGVVVSRTFNTSAANQIKGDRVSNPSKDMLDKLAHRAPVGKSHLGALDQKAKHSYSREETKRIKQSLFLDRQAQKRLRELLREQE